MEPSRISSINGQPPGRRRVCGGLTGVAAFWQKAAIFPLNDGALYRRRYVFLRPTLGIHGGHCTATVTHGQNAQKIARYPERFTQQALGHNIKKRNRKHHENLDFFKPVFMLSLP
jgi:hypothetical protein